MGILGWIILGGLAGWLASLIAGRSARQGCLMDIVVGIFGALLGGFVFNAVTGIGITGFNAWSLFVAVVGAVVLVWIVEAIRGRR
ncbi:MAG: GlsB/YeaQ/YmgE family stress response membrane protein [Anaerolineae bacterium]|nr:GlsB/YeaQ/YmgE family stress response membrane protein [Anaerolineae bacterium]